MLPYGWRLRRLFYWAMSLNGFLVTSHNSTQRYEKLCEAIRLPPVIPTEAEGSLLFAV